VRPDDVEDDDEEQHITAAQDEDNKVF